MKLAKAILSSSLLLLGGILAHHLVSNEFSTKQSLVGFVLLSISLALFLNDDDINEAKLFVAVFIAQNASHLLLGGNLKESPSMAISHTFAGIVSYIAIFKGSEILSFIREILRTLYLDFLKRTTPQKNLDFSFILRRLTPYVFSFKDFTYNPNIHLRAPPYL